mgnify:CR=1 FL=1
MLDSGGKIVTSQLTIPSQSFYLRAAACCVLRSKLSNVASKASNVGSVPSNMHYTELRLQRYNIEKAMSRVCFVKES